MHSTGQYLSTEGGEYLGKISVFEVEHVHHNAGRCLIVELVYNKSEPVLKQ